VICAITLSLAYPVREYIAQRRQIDQLVAEQVAAQTQVRSLQAEQQRLTDPAYVEQQAEDRLGYCFPTEKCYVIVGGQVAPDTVQAPSAMPNPWYAKVWRSVKQADSSK
jgi:cell division protein FtsB